MGWCTLGDGDGLVELGRRFQVVNATADNASGRQDGTVLSPLPAVADADGPAMLELQLTAHRAREMVGHGITLRNSSWFSRMTYWSKGRS